MASASSHQTSSSKWSEIVEAFYPEALSRTHTVPPVHFNRVPYALDTVPGTGLAVLRQVVPGASQQNPVSSPASQPVSALPPSPPPPPQGMWAPGPQTQPKDVQDSDFRDDAAQARVIRNLEELGRHRQEVMFILSQFDLENYLNKRAYRVAARQLPRPSQLNRRGANFSRGEFDVLIIHRRYGILIGEAKSVGHNFAALNMTEAQCDAPVVKRVGKSLKQLDKLESVVKHLVSDVTPQLIVRTALFLPNISRAQLLRVLAANPQLEQDVLRTLHAATSTQAAQLCCCEDDMSPRDAWWDITEAVLQKLTGWWESRMDMEDLTITDEDYLAIVARFVGPASSVAVSTCSPPRVEVRTEGQAVAELGRRLSRLVLTPEQWDLRSKQLPLVFLNGPPGTGKTLMLVLEGVSWLLDNNDVYVVSTHAGTVAICAMIAEQLKNSAVADPTSPTPVGGVQLRHYNFISDDTALGTAVSDLTAAAQGGAGVLIDEADFNTRNDREQRTYSLVEQLIQNVPGLHLWCAGLFHHDPPPSGLQAEVLTTPLRNAPEVLREVRPALDRVTAAIHNYTDNGIPAPGDGQRVRRLRHEGDAHTGRWPVHCEQCGKDIVSELRRLGVGDPDSGVTFRDVFILTQSDELQEEVTVGEVTSPASGVVRGVRGEGMPVYVVGGDTDLGNNRQRWEREAADTGRAATDRIAAAHWRAVEGLERKVVVWLPGRRQDDDDDQYSDQDIEAADRVYLVSRCTTQLVVVDVPRVTHQAADSDHTDNSDSDSSTTGGVGGGSHKRKDNSDNTGASREQKRRRLSQ